MTIDWTDKRAIGLKYKFLNSDEVFNIESLKVHKGILYIDNIGAGRAGTNEWTKTIQLAQGDKTPYDGKSKSPLPANVYVWIKDGYGDSSITLSQYGEWDAVVEYQVQEEMPEEKTHYQAMDAVIAESKDKTVPIKQSTIDEIVDCLENGREYIEVEHNRYKELNQYPSYARGEAMCKNELDAIDKLIKELKDKQ